MKKVIFLARSDDRDQSVKLLNDNNLAAANEIITYKDFGEQELSQLRDVVALKLALENEPHLEAHPAFPT